MCVYVLLFRQTREVESFLVSASFAVAFSSKIILMPRSVLWEWHILFGDIYLEMSEIWQTLVQILAPLLIGKLLNAYESQFR